MFKPDRPEYIPDDFVIWAKVQPYSMASGGYDVIRYDSETQVASVRFGTFVCESDAELFAKLKNDVLLGGGGI